jgi:hypothetical protein
MQCVRNLPFKHNSVTVECYRHALLHGRVDTIAYYRLMSVSIITSTRYSAVSLYSYSTPHVNLMCECCYLVVLCCTRSSPLSPATRQALLCGPVDCTGRTATAALSNARLSQSDTRTLRRVVCCIDGLIADLTQLTDWWPATWRLLWILLYFIID